MLQDRLDVDPFSQCVKQHPKQGQRALELNREGQDLLNTGKAKAAERKFREAIEICEYAIPALNNLALCMQLRGDIKRAIRTVHRVLDFHPTDVFAQCTLAECYQEMGRTDNARSHVKRAVSLLENPDIPLEKLLKVLEALARLNWDEKIIDVYLSYREGIGFEDAMDGISWFYIGVAAANLGLIDEALSHLRRAFDEDHRIKLAQVYAEALLLVRDNKVPSFRFLYQAREKEEALDPKHPSDEIKPILVTGLWDKSLDEDYGHHVVELLTVWEDVWAEEFLRSIITQPELSDDVKMHAVTALVERGALDEDEPIEMLIDGVKRMVVINKEEVPTPSPEATKQFELGLSRAEARDTAGAEGAYRKALKINPDFPEVLVNLANICRSTDRTEEGAQMLERAIELTGNVRAVLNLAVVYILEQDRIEEGEDLLSLLEMDDIDEDLLPIYHRLIGHLAVYSGDFHGARDAFNKMISLDPNDETAMDLLEWVARAEAVSKADLAIWTRRRERYLRQPVDPKMPLVMALQNLTKNNMIGITYWYDLSYGTLRKAELAQVIADNLRSEEIDILEGTSDESWEVLEFLADVGGSAPLAELEEKFGGTEDDSIDWKYELPTSSIGELQSMGLLFVGQDASKKTIAFIPKEILQRLSEMD